MAPVKIPDLKLIHDIRMWLAGIAFAISAVTGAFFLLGKLGVFEYERRLTVIETKLEVLANKIADQGAHIDRAAERLDKKLDDLTSVLIRDRKK